MRFTTNDDQGVDLILGGDRETFEMCFTRPALERFLGLGQEALTQAKTEQVEQGAH
ncbi:hypothetical protein ACTG9Q_21865 [Actinokineospora sp. 24-640]